MPSTAPSSPDGTASPAGSAPRRGARAVVGRIVERVAAGDRWIAAGMLLLVVLYCAIPGVFQGKHSGDGFFGFAYLRALVYHHTLDMQPVLPTWVPFFGVDAHTHHMPNRNPIGPVGLWMPFYLLGCGVAELWRLFGGRPIDPGSPFHAWMAGLGTLAAVLVGYRQLFVLCRRHAGVWGARLGASMAIWATPIAWYAIVQPLYQHGAAFGLTALLVERWDARRGELQVRRFVLLGLVAGWAMAVRMQELLFLLLPGVEILDGLANRPAERLRWLRGGAVLAACAAVAFVPQLVVWRYYGGSWLKPVQIEPLRLGEPTWAATLFGMRGGLFPWSPAIYASVVAGAIAVARRRALHLLIPLCVVFALDVWVVASAWVTSGGYGFGARRLSDGATLFGLALAVGWDAVRARWLRRALVGLAAFGALFTLVAGELQREGRTRSSSSMARTRGSWVREAKGPEWLARALEWTGDPFVQPAGWIFALLHRVPPATFEAVVGQYGLERDGQWFQVQPDARAMSFDLEHRWSYPAGLVLAPAAAKQPARVTGPVRALVPLFLKEGVQVTLAGAVPDGPIGVRWNGATLVPKRVPLGFSFTVPESEARHGINELGLELPAGSTLAKIELVPLAPYRRK